MARTSLSDLRQRLKEREPGQTPFWSPMENLELKGTASVRFLPFEDKISGSFWTTKEMLRAYFLNPDNPMEKWTVWIPCLEMYQFASQGKCPVASMVREVYNEADRAKNAGDTQGNQMYFTIAQDHWKKRAYYFQGFVDDGKVNPNEILPIRLPKSLFDIIERNIKEGDSYNLDVNPVGEFGEEDIKYWSEEDKIPPDYKNEEDFLNALKGRCMIVKKTKKATHFNYETSEWNLNESHEFNDEQLQYIINNGFLNTRSFLPEKPTEEQYKIYCEMMEISLSAALGFDDVDNTWNPEWETKYKISPYKPNKFGGQKSQGGDNSTETSLRSRLNSRAAPVVEQSNDEAEAIPDEQSAKGVLQRMRNRRGTSAEVPTNEEETEVVEEEVAETAEPTETAATAPEPKAPEESSQDAESSTTGKSASLQKLQKMIAEKTKAAKEASDG